DITERKQAEKQLHNEKERFFTLSKNAPFGMIMIDKDGNFIYVNSKFKELLGYDLNDIPDGRTWFRKAYPDPEYRHTVVSAWIDDLKERKVGEKRPREFIITCKDGTKKIIEFISVKLETGEYITSCEDITFRKRAEEILLNEKEKFLTLLDNAPFGMVMISQNGTITYTNQKFEEIFGYEPKDIPNGRTWFRKAYPDTTYRHEVISAWINDLEEGRVGEQRPRVFTATCKDGSTKIINFIPVMLATGDNLMACEDITGRKKAEEAVNEERLKLRKFFDNLPVLAYNISLDGKIMDCNPVTIKTLGYESKEEVIGKVLVDTIYAPSSRQKASQLFERWKKEGKLKNEEIQIITRQGKILDVLLNVDTIYDMNGNPLPKAESSTPTRNISG
ncbi:MAG: PAS domain-containing protein, partial [Proteobacteria bacterium]|nr:PAS domain-containing protein [Pseudomonadota bacterium]